MGLDYKRKAPKAQRDAIWQSVEDPQVAAPARAPRSIVKMPDINEPIAHSEQVNLEALSARPQSAFMNPQMNRVIPQSANSGVPVSSSGFVPGKASGNRYDTLSDRSKAFYDGFQTHMKDNYSAGINIASGGRTQEEQNHIYGQGRTRPGNKVTWTKNSHHIGGNAIDVVGSNWYKDQAANTLIAEQMRAYATQNPHYGASFLPMAKDPNHVQFVL